MKRLILSALVLGAASQAAGCIIVSDDDPVGNADVGWALLTADGNGNPVTANCPQGANTAKVFSLRDGDAVGDAFIDKFNCQDGAGLATDLPTGNYLIWVQLTDNAETTLFAESGSIQAVIADGATTVVDHSIFVDHAFINLSWRIMDPGGTRVPCATVGNEDGVSIAASTPGGGLIDTLVDCESGDDPAIAITDPLPINMEWTLDLALLDAQENVLGSTEPAIPAGRELDYGNEFQDLGTHDILLQ
jgi:hypothetical protein